MLGMHYLRKLSEEGLEKVLGYFRSEKPMMTHRRVLVQPTHAPWRSSCRHHSRENECLRPENLPSIIRATSIFFPINRRHVVCVVALETKNFTFTGCFWPMRHDRREACRSVWSEYPVW